MPGLAESERLTNIEALELDRLPEHLIVIGGGYVGLEFAQAYRRFGSRVTILQQAPQVLAHEEPDVASELLQVFGSEGICVVAPAKIVSVHCRSGERVEIRARTRRKDNCLQRHPRCYRADTQHRGNWAGSSRR